MRIEGRGVVKGAAALVIILLPAFFAQPGQAEVTYRDVSRSLNESLRGSQNNVVAFALTMLAVIAAVLAFRLLRPEKKEEAGRQRPRLALRPPGQQQKRSWYRLKTNAEFNWVHARDALKVSETQYKIDRLVDISGGGLCFRTAEKLNIGDNIKILLDLPGNNRLALSGQVLRSQEKDAGNWIFYQVSVQFRHITGSDRDRLVSLIMKRQRDSIYVSKDKGDGQPPGHDARGRIRS